MPFRQLDTLFDSIFPPTPNRRPFRAQRIKTPQMTWPWPSEPAADLHELDDAFEIRMDLPGVTRDAVAIAIDQGDLVISGTRELPDATNRWTGAFERRFRLDGAVAIDDIEATLRDGVLTIRIPRNSAEAATRHIKINP